MVVPVQAWVVPGLLSKTAKRGVASRTTVLVQALVVLVSLENALCSLIDGTIWALSGTAVSDIFA